MSFYCILHVNIVLSIHPPFLAHEESFAREGLKHIDILDKELIDHVILFSFTEEYSLILGENRIPSKTMF